MSMLFLWLFACGEKAQEAPAIPSSEPDDTDTTCDQDTDADCDGVIDEDDCAPNDGLVYPGAPEIPYDGKDNDCAGDGDLNDVDGDGYIGIPAGGDDCNDNNASVYPGAPEICYDGLDQDCAGDLDAENNNDCDGDGHIGRGAEGTDCDDEDPNVNPDMEEIWYDGVDQDCDSHDDFDSDFDGDPSADYGGGDCDDTDPLTNSLNLEVWDGFDRDCDGIVDNLDSFDSQAYYYATALSEDRYLGMGAAPMGDLDGDGMQELALSAPLAVTSDDGISKGRVYIVSPGVQEGLVKDIAYATIEGGEGAYLGYDLSGMGDLDGDGITDIAFSSPSYNEVYLFAGSVLAQGGVIPLSSKLSTMSGVSLNGIDVHNIGDVDGDGYDDLATGTGNNPNADAWVAIWSGAAIGQGGSFGLSDTLAVLSDTGVGAETAGGFDFDGDGLGDFVTSYNTSSSPIISIVSGVDLAVGGNLELSDYAALSGSAFNADGDPSSFAHDIGYADDIDGDGYAELLVGASRYDTASFASAGRVYVVDGGASISGSIENNADIIFEGSEDCAELSTNDHSADYDGDGIADIIVSHLNTDVLNCQNSIYTTTHVFLGANLESGTYLSTEGDSYFTSRSQADAMGLEAHGFDLDNDGDDDLMLGAPYSGGSSLGTVTVFLSQLVE